MLGVLNYNDLKDMDMFNQQVSILLNQSSISARSLRSFNIQANLSEVITELSSGAKRILIEKRANLSRQGSLESIISSSTSSLVDPSMGQLAGNKDDDLLSNRSSFERIVTQTDIIKYLIFNASSLGSIVNEPVSSLALISKNFKLIYAKKSMSVMEAFYMMYQHRVHGLPVISKRNKLVSTLSSSDIKNISKDTINWLELPVGIYLKRIHGGHLVRPITVSPKTTLLQVMEIMSFNKIHRIWVVDDTDETNINNEMTNVSHYHHHRAVGVITYTDILRLFA
eukprot:TRINITY_DN3885_c0_g1_i3.p1 TRINITY_DN3885_c0_g1~~TRINITY_DN3885_c0_g1_i3.p1  ORF type:complete len:282 (+),score=45.68 TRINITY_DN3885_c0_g1_i3:77-922(+)